MTEYILIGRPGDDPPVPPTGTFEPNLGSGPGPPEPPGPFDADMEIVRQPSGTGFSQAMVARTVAPIVPSATLPRLYMDNGTGQHYECQVDGLTRDSEDKWDTVLCSGFITPGTDDQRYHIQNTGNLSPSPGVYTDNLSSLRLEMKVANIGTYDLQTGISDVVFECDFMGYAAGEVVYEGEAGSPKFLKTTRYFAPFVSQGPGGEECLLVVAFVTQRADAQIYELDFLITNGKCDITESPFDVQDAVDGNVYFDYIKLTGLSAVGAGWGARTLTDRPFATMDSQAEPQLVVPYAGMVHHVMGPRAGFSRRLVVGDLSLFSTEMKDVAEWRDRGTCYGDNSYFMRAAYGETKCYVPHPPPTFQWGGETGRKALSEFDRDQEYEPTVAGLASGNGGGLIGSIERGWQHVHDQDTNPGAGGGNYQETYMGWHVNYYGFMGARMQMVARIERSTCFTYSKTAGTNQLAGHTTDLHSWAKNNSSDHVAYDASQPGAADKFPWDSVIIETKKASHMNPLFFPRNVWDSGPTSDDHSLQPYDRPWNAVQGGYVAPWENAHVYEEGGQGGDYLAAYKGTHCGRAYHASTAVFWATGDVIAKEHLRAAAGFYLGPNSYGVQGFDRSNGFNTQRDSAHDIPRTDNYITENNYGGQSPTQWHRNVARKMTLNLQRYCFESDAYRTVDKVRWEAMADLWFRSVDPRGIVCRNLLSGLYGDFIRYRQFEDPDGTHPGYGPTDTVTRTGALPDCNDHYADPSQGTPDGTLAWDVLKTWLYTTMVNSGLGLTRAVFERADIPRFTQLRGHIQNWWEYAWATQPATSSYSFLPKYLTVGLSDKFGSEALAENDSHELVSLFTQQEPWHQQSLDATPEWFGHEDTWVHMGCWHQSAYDNDENHVERDMLLRGSFNVGSGLGAQDIASYCEFRWTEQNNHDGHQNQNISQHYGGSHMHNAAPAIAHAQVILGLQETWMIAGAP